MLAAGLAYVVLDERLGIIGAGGLAIGLLGILVIAGPAFGAQQGRDDYVLGVAYVLLAAGGITASNVAFARLAGTVDALMAAGTQLLIGTVPLAGIALLSETPADVEWSATFLASLFGLALPGTALVYWLWLSVLETVPLNRANAFSFLIPIFGLTMGVALYGEALTVSMVAGASLAFLGIFLVNRDSRVAAQPVRSVTPSQAEASGWATTPIATTATTAMPTAHDAKLPMTGRGSAAESK